MHLTRSLRVLEGERGRPFCQAVWGLRVDEALTLEQGSECLSFWRLSTVPWYGWATL